MAGRWLVRISLLVWLSLSGAAKAQSVPYTYAYPYGWGGWKPSDEWVKRDAFGRPYYLGWRINVPYPLPQFTYRQQQPDLRDPMMFPGHFPPAEFFHPPLPEIPLKQRQMSPADMGSISGETQPGQGQPSFLGQPGSRTPRRQVTE